MGHDVVRDVLFDGCRRVGISAKKEVLVNFLTGPRDGRSTLRPVDILVFGWIGGKHACVDLTGVSPLVGLGSEDFTVVHTTLKVVACKVVKHEDACIENQHVFVPFAFDTFGFLTPEAVELLNRVQRVMHSNVISPRSIKVVFKRIAFVIQKGLVAQLVAHFPSIDIRKRLNMEMKDANEKQIFKGDFFSHDTLFIGDWNSKNAKNMVRMLRCFHVASNLKINLFQIKLIGGRASQSCKNVFLKTSKTVGAIEIF
uniref:Uncharacterized protein n=1 Tax=Lactuca sativa TaxID=4236 RepID=A0A9R1VXQ6_LACSA|nr:hypothetical protein LSAT_V11C400188450 [Lactuca sativa]